MMTTNRSIVYTQNNRFVRQRKKRKLYSIFRVPLIVAIACCVIFIKSRFSKLHKPASQHRIAIIIPYLSSNGPYLPPYMGIFLQSAAGSKDLVDFLIFHNGQLRPSLDDSTIDGIFIPSNVKFINLGSMDTMSNLLLRV